MWKETNTAGMDVGKEKRCDRQNNFQNNQQGTQTGKADEKPLNQFYNEYRAELFDKREFEAKIFKHILTSKLAFGLIHYRNKDECVDFLCWLYPRFSKAIEKYKSDKACFDTYVNSIVRMADREYRIRAFYRQDKENAAWNEKARDLVLDEEDAASNAEEHVMTGYTDTDAGRAGFPDTKKKANIKNITNPRQVLMLLLKSYYFAHENLVIGIAPSLGMTSAELWKMINQLHMMRRQNEEKMNSLRERCFLQYFRCISCENRLRLAEKDSNQYIMLSDKARRQRIRLTGMRNRLKHMRIEASNQQIADILGIPKGTVDSTIHLIKRNGIGLPQGD
jgi:biotin operon repressor